MTRFSKACPICACSFTDSNCTHFDGNATVDDPLYLEPTLDDYSNTLLECGPSGLGAFLPPWLLNPPACHVYSNVEQPMAYDTPQNIFFNLERYDTDSMHDVSDLNKQATITFNTPGIYFVTLNVRWKKMAVDSGDQAVFIQKNGASYIALDSLPIADADLFGSHSLSVEEKFEAGDFISAQGKQDAVVDDEGQTSFITVSRFSPVFSACFLRPSP